jgi:hypothetical protein
MQPRAADLDATLDRGIGQAFSSWAIAIFHFVIPAKAGLRRQDAVANIGVADGPKGKPQDAASSPVTLLWQPISQSLGPGYRSTTAFAGTANANAMDGASNPG